MIIACITTGSCQVDKGNADLPLDQRYLLVILPIRKMLFKTHNTFLVSAVKYNLEVDYTNYMRRKGENYCCF